MSNVTTSPGPPTSSLAAFLKALSWSRARKDPDFDAGINTSSAWTESLTTPEGVRASLVNVNLDVNVNSLSDDETEDVQALEDDDSTFDSEVGKSARALYAFVGKPEFRELTAVEAGDRLEVLREEVGDGWSLVRHLKTEEGGRSEVGLLPCTYYIYTADFVQAPDLELPMSHERKQNSRREASTSSITPHGSPTRQVLDPPPIVPQTTGEWFPSFRRSLLGGKQLNRFSSFVTSGAEEWVLQGTSETVPQETEPRSAHDRDSTVSDDGDSVGGLGEADRHFVETGPAWRTKVPPFRILVHSPSKRSSMLSGAYTMYSVTSLFDSTEETEYSRPASPVRITVHRRFSHFVVLHTALTRRLPGIALPPLPEKQYAGRFNDDFVEARRGDLDRYLNRVVRHPVARYAEVLTFFLGCESDAEWKKQYPRYLSYPPAGPSFYAHVFHPAFNLDSDDASEAVDRFVTHTKAVGNGVQDLRSTFGKVREASIEMSKAQRLLAYALLSLVTSKPLASAPTMADISEEDEEADPKLKGHMNEDGAWCWREGCEECLKLTKAMQKTSETLQSVADLYDDHARRTHLVTHEGLKSVAHPSAVYSGVIDTHRSTLSRYNEAIQENMENEEVAARCETVLNTTMAEFETYHNQKIEDFQSLTTDYLDGEIALYEQILTRLRTTRRTFQSPMYDTLGDSPRQPSIYERELERPRLTPSPLTQPCPHIFDSTPMRPVSVAIQEGVGMLLSPTRASVFGKFW